MARRAKKPARVEQDGLSVRLYRKREIWFADIRIDGERQRVSLRTREKATAETNAQAFAHEIARQRITGVSIDGLTLGQLFDWYRSVIATKLNKKGAPVSHDWRVAAETRMQLFEKAWRRDVPVTDIGQAQVDAFISQRRAGTLTALAAADAEKGRKAIGVRLGTTDGDLRWLKACFNYATKHTVQGRAFLQANPLSRVTWPKEREQNKLRPRASADRYAKTQEHTDTVDPTGALRCALALARHTGHRESAILKLRVDDVLRTTTEVATGLRVAGRDEADAKHMPHGAILWRAENDKMGAAHLSALNAPARRELDLYLFASARPADAWLFPSPKVPGQPLHRRLASRQLVKAETLAELEKLKGGTWHPYRRAWATDRKGLPDIDVAASGGWSDTRALKLSYQQSDAATMFSVVSHGTE